MQEGGERPGKGRRRAAAGSEPTKRVEDSMRIATFLGGLQRGQSVREAADARDRDPLRLRRSDADREARVPARDAVLHVPEPQHSLPGASSSCSRPGKYATVEKAREEAPRRRPGCREGYEENLSEFEARQLPLPIQLPMRPAAEA